MSHHRPRARSCDPEATPLAIAGACLLVLLTVPLAGAPAGASVQAPIPSREDEVARDAYSRPQEVYDFIGIGRGDVVADLLAGDGYNTYLLSLRVGPEGKVYVEGASPRLQDRLERGDLADAGNVEIVGGVAELPTGVLDAVAAVRAYHLFPDVPATLAELHRALKPGGTVGVVEVRLNQPYGHDMTSHRVGERTVIEDFEAAGFEYVGSSDLLRREGDDYNIYRSGERHMTDRMLLKFRKPE